MKKVKYPIPWPPPLCEYLLDYFGDVTAKKAGQAGINLRCLAFPYSEEDEVYPS